jgi:hypothetical protein
MPEHHLRRPQAILALGAAAALLAGVALLVGKREGPPPQRPESDASALPDVPPPAPLPPRERHPAATELAAALEDPGGSAEEDLQTFSQLLYLYRQAFGGNPEGGNEDVAAALLGENPAGVAFLPEGASLSGDGQLLDRWGTPYWFHALSGREMEIRSAGPDRELFTADDLALP